MIRTLKSEGFELRKWKSNLPVEDDKSHEEKSIRDDGDDIPSDVAREYMFLRNQLKQLEVKNTKV